MPLNNKTIKDTSGKNCTSWWHCLHLAINDTFWEYTRRTRVSGIWLLRPHRTHGVSRFVI